MTLRFRDRRDAALPPLHYMFSVNVALRSAIGLHAVRESILFCTLMALCLLHYSQEANYLDVKESSCPLSLLHFPEFLLLSTPPLFADRHILGSLGWRQ